MNIGISIKKIRKDKKLSQTEFGIKVKVSQTYLSQIESGKKTPTIKVLERISKRCEIPLPIIFWFGIEMLDIPDSKKEHFEFLKPSIDSMIESIY